MKSARWMAGIAAFTIALTCIFASPATALDDKMMPIAIPAQPNAIELGTGTLPGATTPESWHSQYGRVFARNVTVATLTAFLPDPAKATGAAVIVAPGGGFRTLSMENEGWDVARALADKGVAAFVLKYRLVQTPPDMAGFERAMTAMFSSGAARPPMEKKPAVQYAPQIADARAAFALVRSRSKEWHVDPDRIGMVGFSGRRYADPIDHAVRPGRQAGLHRRDLWPAGARCRARRRATAFYRPCRRRPVLRQFRFRPDR